MENPGIEQPIYIESFSEHRRHWYTATEGDAVHRFPVQLGEIWNQYLLVGAFDSAGIQALVNDGDADGLGVVTLRKNKALSLVPGTTQKYQLTSPDPPIAHVITATKGQVAPVAGHVGPVTTAVAAPSGITGYTPVITDANGTIHPMQASTWVVDGVNAYVEFPYGVPSDMVAPFTLTFYEYTGITGGGSMGPGSNLWHYVADATSPFLTLCPSRTIGFWFRHVRSESPMNLRRGYSCSPTTTQSAETRVTTPSSSATTTMPEFLATGFSIPVAISGGSVVSRGTA